MSVQGPPILGMSQLLIQEEEQHTCGTSVEARYSELLRTHIVRAYDRADRGELWGPEATAAVKLRTLEGAIKDELLRAGLNRGLVARWSLFNSNIFDRAALPQTPADSPIIVTLNCAPLDDGGAGVCCSSWTPDYLSAIVDSLQAAGLWDDVVPLVAEFRAVCPVLVAASDAGVTNLKACSGCGWACGDYPEERTTPGDRWIHARCLRTTHLAASASWIRLNHAKCPASAVRLGYDNSDVGNYCPDATRAALEVQAPPYIAHGCLNLNALHPGHDAYLGGALLAVNVAVWAAALVRKFGSEPPADLDAVRAS